MTTSYSNTDRYLLQNVTVNGIEGHPGRFLEFNTGDNFDQNPGVSSICDVDEDDLMDAGVDYFGDPSSTANTFTGYTYTVGGETFPIFEASGNYYLFGDGLTNFETPIGDVTSNPFTAEIATNLCFLPGTAIMTPDGDVAVEDLKIGDLVQTADGQGLPVKWLAGQTVMTAFGSAERLQPVQIGACGLGDGLPLRDLRLVADHSLLLDGMLVDAGALVNGGSIKRIPVSKFGDSHTVYHVETPDHDIILAEGSATETYIDYVARRVFDNYAEYVALYDEDCAVAEMPFARVSSARMLPEALRRRLAVALARAA